MKADAVKCRPFTCVSCQVPQFCLSASRSLRRLIPKSKSRENADYRYKAIVVNTPYRKNTLSQKVLASYERFPILTTKQVNNSHTGGSVQLSREVNVSLFFRTNDLVFFLTPQKTVCFVSFLK